VPLPRVFEHQEYRPEYGTFVVRDVPRPDRVRPRVGALLAPYAVRTQPSGSFARAGDGWVEGVAADGPHDVRIEVYDAPPADGDLADLTDLTDPADPAGWDDVVDTPFASSGVVRLALTVIGPIGEAIELGPPGMYRIRFARRPVTPGDDPAGRPCVYLLRFWPVDTPPEPPRWLRRTGPLVDGRAERDAFDGSYRSAVTDVVMLALWAAESATPVTVGWLADRMLTTVETVRAVIGHPWAARLLSIAGDLGEDDAPLTVTVLTNEPLVRRHALPTVPGRPGRPAQAVSRATPARQATPGIPAVRAARPAAARPMAKRHGEVPGADPGPAD
jgi:hypothetical protein